MARRKRESSSCFWEHWQRKERRLTREVPTIVVENPHFKFWFVKPLYENHTEILSFNQVKENLIQQVDVCAKDAKFQCAVPQTSPFFGLPDEIILTIFDLLTKSDIITMATTCRTMAEFVNRNFVPSVELPLASRNVRKLDGRYVLSIKSIFNIMPLEKLKRGDYLKNLKKMCLKKLQTLVFFLYNYYDDEHFPLPFHNYTTHDHILPCVYKEILTYYVSEARTLTHLYISIDRSKETFELIEKISSLPCLKDVILLAVNTPYNVRVPIECEVSQQLRDEDQKFQFPASSNTLNHLLATLLHNDSIKSLEILGLHSCQIWGEYTYLERPLRQERYPLELKSNSLKRLRIEQHDFFDVQDIQCPEMLSVELVDYGAGISEFKCLKHSDMFINGYETLLEGCPLIERVNEIDLKSLRKKLDSNNQWEKILDEICKCDDHEILNLEAGQDQQDDGN